MKFKKKVSIEEVNFLEEIDAERVSLVNRGANLTPLAIFKAEDQMTIDKVEFDTESYDTDRANNYMKSLFDESSYELIQSENVIIAKSTLDSMEGEVRGINIDEGVTLYVNKPTLSLSKQESKCDTLVVSPNEEKVNKMSIIDEVLTEVRAKFAKTEEAAETEKVEETQEVEAKTEETAEEGKEAVKEEAEESKEEDNSEEAKEETTEEKSEESEEAKSEEKVELNKFDYFAAVFSESSDLGEVLKEGMSDGIPVGFDELTASFTTALSNAIKKGEMDKVADLAKQMGDMLQGIVDLTKSEDATEEVEKEEVIEEDKAEEAKEEATEEVEKSEEAKEEPALSDLDSKLDTLVKSMDTKVSQEEVTVLKDTVTDLTEKVTKLADQMEGLRYGSGSSKAVKKQSEVTKKSDRKIDEDKPGAALLSLLS